MNFAKLLPLTACLLVGCASQSPQQKPTPVSAQSSPADAQAVEMERQREKQMPCSAEWLKTATEVQKKDCLKNSSINQAMNALSTRPSSKKKTPSATTDKH
jgi:hypothetical protein